MKKILVATFLSIQILFAADIYATFDVVSDKSSELGLSISGVVGTLHVNVGDKLKKGELLLSLENTSERQEVENGLFLNKQGKSPMVLRNGLKPLFSLKQALIFHLQATKLILET